MERLTPWGVNATRRRQSAAASLFPRKSTMKSRLRKLFRPVRLWFDRLITQAKFRRYYANALQRCVRGNAAHDDFKASGFELLRQHYYLPLPDECDLAMIHDSDLVGLDIDENACLEFFESNLAKFGAEFREFPLHRSTDENGYHIVNGTFMAVDGNVYYGLIRKLAPKRIIEVGSGNSTKLAASAIRRNIGEQRRRTELVCVEPSHSEALSSIDEITEIIPKYVQEVDMHVFESLEAGDLLFLDSTHTFRPGGDVWWEFCEVLPRLAAGVLVHIHDVSLPNPYPSASLEKHWYWMEQYVLQAFLAFNSRFEVVWPGNLLMLRHRDRMREMFGPEYEAMLVSFPSAEPASFWVRVRL